MKISLIVPVYNAAPWLPRCMESLLSQIRKADEIIFVDDGSTDGSGLICENYARQYPFVKTIRIPNGGPSGARNRGVAEAQGNRVVFVDADDVADARLLATLCEISEKYPDAEMVCSPLKEFKGERPKIKKYGAGGTSGCTEVISGKRYLELMLCQTAEKGGVSSSVCGKMFRTSLWRSEEFEPGLIYEDLEAMSRIAVQCQKVALTDKPLYYYRHTPGSITTTFLPRRSDALRVAETISRRVSPDTRLGRAARNRVFSAAFNLLLLISAHDSGGEMNREARRCRELIKNLRGEALTGRGVRMRNRLGGLMAYVPGLRVLCIPGVAKKILKR